MPGAPGSPSFDGWARDGLSLAALRAFAHAHAGERFALPSAGGAGSASVAFEQLTSGQVLELVVKPATAADACSYAALLIAQARAAARGPRAPRSRRGCGGARVAVRVLTRRTRGLGATPSARAPQNARDGSDQPQAAFASVFVTHAWSANFLELLDALATAEGAEGAYFWIGARATPFRPQCRAPQRPG